MKSAGREFLNLSCNLYIAAMLAALPLYAGQGYWQLGNTKYALFRSVTVLCLGGWLVLGLLRRLWVLAEKVREYVAGKKAGKCMAVEAFAKEQAGWAQGAVGSAGDRTRRPGPMDLAVAAYGVTVLLSALCSAYGELAWRGYEGWFMGAFSQLLFAGIYFFVSRRHDGSMWPLYLGEAALFLATVLGLLHRLGFDPLGLMEGWNSGDWEYSHMLSTLGNINWLCGYYSVALAVLTAHFLWEKRPAVRCLLYIAEVLAFVLLGVQGSQGGLLILAVCAGSSLVWGGLGGRLRAVAGRICLAGAGFCVCMPLLWQLMLLRGKKAAIVADGNIFEYVEWYVWGLGAAICLVCGVLAGRKWYGRKAAARDAKESGCEEALARGAGKSGCEEALARDAEKSGCEEASPLDAGKSGCEEALALDAGKSGRMEASPQGAKESGCEEASPRDAGESPPAGNLGGDGPKRKKRNTLVAAVIGCEAAVCASAVCILICCLIAGHVPDGFGSGRGLLWRISVEGFRQMDWKGRLLGAGPDCYARSVFNELGTGTEVWKGEHWEGAVFTNAHNEVLSQLCNVGILGTVSYLSIFFVVLWQCGRSIFRSRGKAEPDGAGGWLCCAAALAAAMYGAYALVSFQQVLSTPLLFLTLGLWEARRRRETEKREPEPE